LGRIGETSAVPHLLAAASALGSDLIAQKAQAHQRIGADYGGHAAGSTALSSKTAPGSASTYAAVLSHDGVDRALEHSIIYALIEIADPAGTREGFKHASPHVQRAALIALDQMKNGGLKPADVAPLLSSSDPVLSATANWIVSHRPEWGGALAGWCRERLAQIDNKTSEADIARFESQLVQFSSHAEISDLLAASPLQSDLPTAARVLALRVIGQVRPKELRATWADALAQVMAGDDTPLAAAAVAAARTIPPQKNIPAKLNAALLTASGNPNASPQTRLEALAAVQGGLSKLEPAQFEFLRGALAAEHPPAMRSAAADALANARLSEAQLESLAETIKQATPLELDRLLAPFDKSTDEALGLKLIAALREASALPSLRVDSLRQRLAKYSPKVQTAIDELHTLVDVDAVSQRARIAELLPAVTSGDVRRGQAVFNSSKAACIACHKFGYLGGLAGPDLTRIGQIRTERDLLESILYPSLSFVRSYEPVVIATTDGRVINGLVRNETSSEIVLATGPNQEVRLRRDEIDEMQPSKVSIMPAGLDKQLTVQELLDLVAFLKNAK
jgi:putative heme-binding domain-containing protein